MSLILQLARGEGASPRGEGWAQGTGDLSRTTGMGSRKKKVSASARQSRAQ